MRGSTSARYFIQILCISVLIPRTYQNRKYDIETESLKLYKEDFGTVLLRFRRSPEYVKILEDKNAEFNIYSDDVKSHIEAFYHDQLEKKIAEMIGYNPEKLEEDTTTDAPSRRSGDKNSGYFRYSGRRQAEEDSKNITGVERLDSYSRLSSTMTLNQRNAMKDLGFQYAGHVIHALIKNMGPDKTDGKSTKISNGEVEVTTTEHVSIHSVTFTRSAEETTPGEENNENPKDDGAAKPQKRFKKKVI